ncbi:MAG: VCBS repeat-containing protein [Desulfobacterales bacterium]|nr:VCBS repeat-containing protein [Desulfobacterales bacterium]
MKRERFQLILVCTLVLSSLLLLKEEAFATSVSRLPIKATILGGSASGGDWAGASKVYTPDLNGDGRPDIVRLNPVQGDDAIKIFLNNGHSLFVDDYKDVIQSSGYSHPGSGLNANRNTGKSHKDFFRADHAGMLLRNFLPVSKALWQYDGRQVDLHFLDADGDEGMDMIRQEVGMWGDYEGTTAGLQSCLIDNGSSVYFGASQELGDEFNGRKGTRLFIGDFNGDGYDDVLRAESGNWADDYITNVSLHHGGETAGIRNCMSLSDSSIAPRLKGIRSNATAPHFGMASGSEGVAEDLHNLFHLDKSDVFVGDFNGDGCDDILRFDQGDSLNNEYSDHPQADIWFGREAAIAESQPFYRKEVRHDVDGDRELGSSDGYLHTELSSGGQDGLILGDFNGDGATDILRVHENDITLMTSVAITPTETDVEHREVALFSKATQSDVLDFNFAGKMIRVGDFNNDGRDDLVVWNRKPYYLLSGIPSSQNDEEQLDVQFLGIAMEKYIDVATATRPDKDEAFTGHTSLDSDAAFLQVADFTGDGYDDLLVVLSGAANAMILATPPYDALATRTLAHDGTVTEMHGTTYRGYPIIVFNDNGTLKYSTKNAYGWQSAKPVPLYNKANDPRNSGDLPPNSPSARFLERSTFIAATGNPLSSTVDYYAKPFCEGGYGGESFDLVSDENHIYLFRVKGEKILLDRFDYEPSANSLHRLPEARYKLSQKRYSGSGGNDVIAMVDRSGNDFFEPAFEVPFVLQANAPRKVTAAIMPAETSGHRRFIIAADSEVTRTLKIASVRMGTDQPFDVSDLTDTTGSGANLISGLDIELLDENNAAAITRYQIKGIDSMVFAPTRSGKPTGLQFVMAMTMEHPTTKARTIRTFHRPLGARGRLKPDSGLNALHYYGYPGAAFGLDTGLSTPMSTANTDQSEPRLVFGSDGLIHLYWRTGKAKDSHYRQDILFEAIFDPEYPERPFGKESYYLTDETAIKEVTRTDWPYRVRHIYNGSGYSHYSAFVLSSLWTPPFGTYYQVDDPALSGKLQTPVVFESATLTEEGGQISGKARRLFVDALKINGGNLNFAVSTQDLTTLTAESLGTVTADSQIIGYIEGAPPVPKENLGLDPSGYHIVTHDSSVVNLSTASSAKVLAKVDQSAGATFRSTLGGQYTSAGDLIQTKILFNNAFIVGADFGSSKETMLGETINRSANLIGYLPKPKKTSDKCGPGESPYKDPCFTCNEAGEVDVQLYHPYNKGVLFTRSLIAEAYALKHPVTGKLVSIQLDFSNAITTPKAVSFNINPAYQIAGSLDGVVGGYSYYPTSGARRVSIGGHEYTINSNFRSYYNPREEKYWRDKYKRQSLELAKRLETKRGSANASELIEDQLLTSTSTVTSNGSETSTNRVAGSLTDYFGLSCNVSADLEFSLEMKRGAVLKAALGGYYKNKVVNSSDSGSDITFSQDISIQAGTGTVDTNGDPIPYTVQEYTTTSYFLPASLENYDTLFERVIDPVHPGDYNTGATASALRLLLSNKASQNRVWRVAHRVSAVSRAMPNPN